MKVSDAKLLRDQLTVAIDVAESKGLDDIAMNAVSLSAMADNAARKELQDEINNS